MLDLEDLKSGDIVVRDVAIHIKEKYLILNIRRLYQTSLVFVIDSNLRFRPKNSILILYNGYLKDYFRKLC